jgi:hypothetical protein
MSRTEIEKVSYGCDRINQDVTVTIHKVSLQHPPVAQTVPQTCSGMGTCGLWIRSKFPPLEHIVVATTGCPYIDTLKSTGN